jgi:hypothetical protein
MEPQLAFLLTFKRNKKNCAFRQNKITLDVPSIFGTVNPHACNLSRFPAIIGH